MRYLSLAILLFLLVLNPLYALQERGGLQSEDPFKVSDSRHTLWGDIRVDESEGTLGADQSFTVILRKDGRIEGQITVVAGGRYRFNNLRNGQYMLSLSTAAGEVYREEILLQEFKNTDVQNDIELIARGGGVAGGSEGEVLYARSGDNEKLFKEAQELSSQGKVKEAVDLLKKVTKADNKDFEAWTELGNAEFARGKHKDAEKAYEKAIEAEPDYLLAMINLGKVQFAEKDYENAIATLDKVMVKDADRADVNQLLGECYLQLKKGSTAVGYLYQALKLDPDGMAEVHIRLGQLYTAAGYKDRAAAEYALFLKKRPDDSRRDELEKFIKENGG